MKYEYLLFNVLVMAGPIGFSFENKVRFASRWPMVFTAIAAVLVPFVLWDALVVGRHWWFNQDYTTGFRVAGLPVEEILFFVSVPFACLFVWEVFFAHREAAVVIRTGTLGVFAACSLIIGTLFLLLGYEYPGLVLLALALVIGLDLVLKTGVLLESRTYRYLGVLAVFILLFNGYLTARPLVLYDTSFQLGIYIFTIPLEDFFYGFALILFTLILYEKLRRVRHA